MLGNEVMIFIDSNHRFQTAMKVVSFYFNMLRDIWYETQTRLCVAFDDFELHVFAT